MSTVDSTGPLPESAFRIRHHPPARIIEWLRLGWRDLIATGLPSYLHGLLVCLTGIALLWATLSAAFLLPGLVSAFALIGPVLATGLYGISRKRETGSPAGMRDAIDAWRGGAHGPLRFGLLLFLATLAWVVASAILFSLFVNVPINAPASLAAYVLGQEDLYFILWTLSGGLGAAIVFATGVITLPLLLERDISTRTAVLTSVRTVGENPLTMACWALLIAIATGLGLATGMLGFIVLYPLLGDASWHAYRDLAEIDDREVPQRNQRDA